MSLAQTACDTPSIVGMEQNWPTSQHFKLTRGNIMDNLQDLVAESHVQAQSWFYGELDEQQESNVNDRSREIVRLMADAHGGECWLGMINLYGNPPLWKWNGQPVLNFSASFVIPHYDADLEKMILDRDAGEYEGTAKDRKLVDWILTRIETLSGNYLYWC